jgi:hypothetical protein
MKKKYLLFIVFLFLFLFLFFYFMYGYYRTASIGASNKTGKEIYLNNVKINNKIYNFNYLKINKYNKKSGNFSVHIGDYIVRENDNITLNYSVNFVDKRKYMYQCVVVNDPVYPCVMIAEISVNNYGECYCDHINLD